MTLSASCFYYYYYVTTVKEPLHQCQQCAWHVLAAPSRPFAWVPSVHYRLSKSDCSPTGKKTQNKTASVCLFVCLSVLPRLPFLSASLPFIPSPWSLSLRFCWLLQLLWSHERKQAVAVTSCSSWGAFVLEGILRPCRLKPILSFPLNQTAVVCAVRWKQERPSASCWGAGGFTPFEGLPDLSLQGSCNLQLSKRIVCDLLSHCNLPRNRFKKN